MRDYTRNHIWSVLVTWAVIAIVFFVGGMAMRDFVLAVAAAAFALLINYCAWEE